MYINTAIYNKNTKAVTTTATQLITISGLFYGHCFKIATNKIGILDCQGGKVKIVSVSNGTIADIGTPSYTAIFPATVTRYYGSGCYVDEDKFSVVAMTGAGVWQCVVATVSGTTITFGSPVAFYSPGADTYASIIALSTSKILTQYLKVTTLLELVRVATISGTTPSFGTQLESAYPESVRTYNPVMLTDSKVLLASKSETDHKIRCRLVDISVSTATFPSANEYVQTMAADANVEKDFICALTSTKVAFIRQKSGLLTLTMLGFDGNEVIESSNTTVMATGAVDGLFVARLSDTELLISARKTYDTYIIVSNL
jgi:hypothetical protein